MGHHPKADPGPVDISKPCKTCRFCNASWISRNIFNDWADALCRNPQVVDNWHMNGRARWLVPDNIFGGPIFPADPVTGQPESRRIPCSMARASQYAPTLLADGSLRSPMTPCPDDLRAPSNCGPDGRYWTPR